MCDMCLITYIHTYIHPKKTLTFRSKAAPRRRHWPSGPLAPAGKRFPCWGQSERFLGCGSLVLSRLSTVGNRGMDPYSRPDVTPHNSPHNPFPHSLLRTKQVGLGIRALGCFSTHTRTCLGEVSSTWRTAHWLQGRANWANRVEGFWQAKSQVWKSARCYHRPMS